MRAFVLAKTLICSQNAILYKKLGYQIRIPIMIDEEDVKEAQEEADEKQADASEAQADADQQQADASEKKADEDRATADE